MFNQIKILFGFLDKKTRHQCAALLILMVLASISDVVSIGALLPFLGFVLSPEKMLNSSTFQIIIKNLGISQSADFLFLITVFFCVAAILSGLMRLLLLWGTAKFGLKVGSEISLAIYRDALYQPYELYVRRNSSEIISAVLEKANNVVNWVILPLLNIIGSSFLLLIVLVSLLVISLKISIAAFLGFGVIYGTVILITKRRLNRAGIDINREHARLVKAVQEGLGGIRDILIDGSQEIYCKSYAQSDLQLRSANAQITFITGAPRFIIESLSIVLIAILAFYISRSPGGLIDAIPVLGVLTLAAQRLLPIIQQLYSNWMTVNSSKAALGDVLDLIKSSSGGRRNNIACPHLPFEHTFELINVSYRYSSTEPWVLKDINLKISKGSCVGIIGSTGSGKSTLLDIVMGLLLPSSGKILIDGKVLDEKNIRSWQKQIAHVPQSIFLADATIAQNIAIGVGNSDINMAQVLNSAKNALIADSIESWEKRYETMVGERGVRLSGGQRQRIGIARAFYKDADVIILDEATSALDNETEKTLISMIENLENRPTILMIAHRISSLSCCDKIVEIKNGHISRICSYQEI